VPSSRDLTGASLVFSEAPEPGSRQEMASIRRQLSSILEVQQQLHGTLRQVSSDVAVLLGGKPHGKMGVLRHVGEEKSHEKSNSVKKDRVDFHEIPADPEEEDEPGFDGERDANGFKIKHIEDRMKVRQSMLVKPDQEDVSVFWSPDDERRQTLQKMFTKAEKAVREELQEQMAKRDRVSYWSDQLWKTWKSRERFSTALDVFVSLAICFNALFLGLSMDYADASVGWTIGNLAFSTIFLVEISFKVYMNGFYGHFCTGPSPMMNCFDTVIILVDFVQVWMELTMAEAALDDTPSASLFRMIRLIRLTRVVRVTKSEAFKDLAELIHGIIAGMYTLVWSLLLFLIVMYVVALVFRETLGRQYKENIYELFDSVPRALFTTFRCSFGDCNSKEGVPIFEYVTLEYGPTMSVFYSLFTFVVAIVLFNVISAMFVESTMEAAATIAQTKRRERMQDENLLFTRIATLVRRIMLIATGRDPEVLSEHLDTIMDAQVPRETIDQVIHDPLAKQALIDLDINPLDHGRLSDIFDPDNGGTIGVMDIAHGIRRLRGEARRSDVVCIDLMIRHVQGILVDMTDAISRIELAVGSS